MKSLSVTLNYSSGDDAPNTDRARSSLALPLLVRSADGSLIAEGVASTTATATFDISQVEGPVFVTLTWPSGKTRTQRIMAQEGEPSRLCFDESSIRGDEWSTWAVPRLDKRGSLGQPGRESGLGIDRFNRVWLRLWRHDEGQWKLSALLPTASYQNVVARQIDLELAQGAWLLQFGGSVVPWRFVALPGGGPCRVLLMPTDSTDPRAEPLKVIVTGFRSDAEALLEFLARDALRAASSLGGFRPLLQAEPRDPIAAVAGGYFLLRNNGWREISIRWFENLSNCFPWSADAAAMACAVRIRKGLATLEEQHQAFLGLKECVNRGVPLFAEGISLMQEASALLRGSFLAQRPPIFQWIENLAASQAWAGAALSFYGESPDRPSPIKLLGIPGIQTGLRSFLYLLRPQWRQVGETFAGGARMREMVKMRRGAILQVPDVAWTALNFRELSTNEPLEAQVMRSFIDRVQDPIGLQARAPSIDSKFRFVLLAARRAEQLMRGAKRKGYSGARFYPTRIAMEEIAAGLVEWGYGTPGSEEESLAPAESVSRAVNSEGSLGESCGTANAADAPG